jgi:transcriptional regulator with XRE-family HTH domain
MNLGHKIKKLRELKNLTQEFVANEIGCTQSAYSKIESGGDLSFRKLEQIAGVLGLELQDILSFNENVVFNITHNKKASGLTINQVSPTEKKLYEDYIETLKAEISHLKKTLNNVLKNKS